VLNQEPVCALVPFPVVGHSNQDEAAMQSSAFESELKIALCQRLLRTPLSLRLPIATVPEHDRAAAVLPLRTRPFEVAIIKRVILDLDGEAFVMWIERWTSGHSPGFEDAIQLQPQIVVQAPSIVLLDDEAATA
jgi:hypothetical protein